MQLGRLWYHRSQSEPDFLGRIVNLKSMKSRDSRYDNGYEEMSQHMVNNIDWDVDWLYTDPRINLLHCDDDTYLKFLAATVHPRVRSNPVEISRLLEIYNKHLNGDGFEISQADEISGKPVYSGREK